MDIGADFKERGRRIRVWGVFSREYRNMAICAVYIFLYMANPKRWDESVFPLLLVLEITLTYLSVRAAPATTLLLHRYRLDPQVCPTKPL